MVLVEMQEGIRYAAKERFFGKLIMLFGLFMPIGMVVFGLMADRTSLRLLMAASGGLLIMVAAVMFRDRFFYRHGSKN